MLCRTATHTQAGGYSGNVINNVKSFDFTSSYPYVMLSEKYPASKFIKCNISKIEDIKDNYCYIVKIKFYDIKSKYINTIISLSKCQDIKGRDF